MNIDSCKYAEESVLSTVADTHLMKMIVIQYTVIDALCTGSVPIDLFPFIRSVEKRAAVTGIIAVVDVNDSSVVRRTALVFEITMIDHNCKRRE